MPQKPEQKHSIPVSEMGELLPPSRELAWMIGVLTGGGSVSPSRQSYRVKLESTSDTFLAEFKSIGERLFHTNPTHRIARTFKDGRASKEVVFYTDSGTILGDLRTTEWPQTIRKKHNWIFQDQRYLWGLIEGLVETKGSVRAARKKSISFNTQYKIVANFIADLLVRVGINHPDITPDRKTREGINRVGVYNLSDIKTIASNIHSSIPEKEKKLEFFRQYLGRKTERKIAKKEAIQEYIAVRNTLGRPPTFNEIQTMYKEGT